MKRKTKKGNNKHKNVKNNVMIIKCLLIIFALLCLLVALFFSFKSYSLWINGLSQSKTNEVSSGCFSMEVNDLNENGQSTSIKLNNAYPISDDAAKRLSPYVLNIKNNCTLNAHYSILLNILDDTTLNDKYVSYSFNNLSNETFEAKNLTELLQTNSNVSLSDSVYESNNQNILRSYVLFEGDLNKEETVSYELRLWLNSLANNQAMGRRFNAVVSVSSVAK